MICHHGTIGYCPLCVTEMDKREQSASCYWRRDGDDSDTWQSTCGGHFLINDGGDPDECQMKFCMFCGKPLVADAASVGGEGCK